MAQAGLFTNPLAPATGAASSLSPLTSAPSPTGTGLDALQQSLADIATIGERALQQVPIIAPQVAAQTGPSIAYSPSTKQFFVQGQVFGEDDAQRAVESEALLGQPGVPLPQGGDWVPVDQQSYAGYLQGIKQPSRGTLAARNFGRGVDVMQLLAGRGLQLLGAEETGGRIVQQQMEDLRKTSPYERQFTDIKSSSDAVDWFVANLAQQGPNLLESIAVAAAGAAAGTAGGGPGLGTIGGAIAGLAGKSAFKQQVLAAARKKAAGEVLDAAETKILRSAAGIAGATAASYTNNMAMGASDIYGELRDRGADPDDVNARMTALFGSLPYAALETLPEFLLAGRVLGGVAAPRAMAAGTSITRRGAELLRRGAVGGAIGGAAEGTTELGQEALLLGLSDQDLSKPENIERLINSFAAGAAIGGPIGAVANLRGQKPADLLGNGNPEPLALPAPPKQLTDQRAASVPAVTPFPQITGPGNVPLLTGPDVIYGEAPAPTPLLPAPPPVGTQGELNLIGGRGVAPAVAPLPPVAAPAPSTEIQDVLPFESGLAPFRYGNLLTQPTGALADNPVLRAVQQRQQEMLAAQQEAQLAAQRQAEFEAAQAAVPPTPGVSPLDQRLAESQPFLDVMGTEGRLVPDVTYGTTPAVAAEEWRALAGRGRPKAFANFLPEIQNQWIDALNMAQAGELTRDDLKTIRTELVRAENKARLSRSTPDVVVTGTITPVPPKGGKARALKKPKATPVAPSKQAGTRGETLKRPVAKQAAKPAGKPVTEPKEAKKETAKPVQKEQGKAVQVLKKGETEQRKPRKQAPSLAEDRSNMTDADRVDSAIRVVEEATTRAIRSDVSDAYYDILELAFFERLSTGTTEARKAIQTKARNFLNQTVSSWHKPILAKAFRQIMLREDVLPADGAWFQYMMDNDLIGAFPAEAKRKVTKIDKIKDDALRAQAEELFAVEPKPVVTKDATFETKLVPPNAAVKLLTNLLDSFMTMKLLPASWDAPGFMFDGVQQKLSRASLARDLYAKVSESDRDVLVNGVELRNYFNKNGDLRLVPYGDPVTVRGGEQVSMMKVEPEGTARFALSSFNQPDRADTALGKLRMAISRFVSKLATKPKVSVFKNQADMKAKNPALYRKAVAARPEGDFDTAMAAGFSFGDGNVVIFTDRIANEQHLKFVLAHETIGHFGLRGIIPIKQFDAVMEAIYNASPAIRSDVDIAMADRDQSRSEAVEEYLSDFAAVLDTSVVARVWNAIKGALNKLGVKFGDEMVRYLLKHSRAYVRNGNSGMFDVATVFGNLQDAEYGKGYVSTGRFSTVGDVYADNRTAELVRDNLANAPLSWEQAWTSIKGMAGNNTDRFDRFKAEFLSLANFRSRLNPGLNRLEQILEAARDLTSSIRVSSNERNAEVFNIAVFGKYFGVTEDETDSINKLMYAAQRLAVSKVKSLKELKGAPLYEFRNGELTPNQPEIDKLIKQGMVTIEQARNGFTYDVLMPDGTTRTEKFEGIPGLTKDSIEWRGYVSLRETVNDVELQLLRARYQSMFEDQKIAFRQFDELVEDKRLTNAERELLRRLIKQYKDLYTADITFDDQGYPKLNTDSMARGNDFVIAVNKALTLGSKEDFERMATFFEGRTADDIVAKMREFKNRLKIGVENKFTIQNRVKQILMLEVSNADADLYTRRTLATGYTPLLREGQFQVRVEAVNPRTGKVVRLADAYREQLIYSQVEKQSEAQQIAAGINDVFKDKTYEVDAYSPDAGEFTKQTVVFRAVPETALDAIAGPPELNLNEFVYGLRQLDIVLTPKEVERVVTALTRQNSSARNRLLRAFTPGADPDAIKAVSRHVDSRASSISKTIMRPQLGELMNLSMESTQRLWNGDPRLLADLKAAAENTNLSPEERVIAQREYARYKYMYEQTNPKGKPKRANQFYNEASRTMSFLDDNRSVAESNFESGEVVSKVRAATSIMQLGGSIATGALNLISAYTNGLPFLASYNPSNGFGGGFGLGPSVAQFHIAAKQVGALGITNMKANTAEFYDAIAKDTALQARYNLKAHEAEFIAREIREGAMIPAQTNALINTARGQVSSGFVRKFVDGWMLPFNLTEQASRRTLGLAAYRLEYERQITGGRSEAKAKEAARRFAVDALNLTMGEYSVLNRPPAWRSGIQSFLYMYKVFPTTSIQLFSNLSRNGKIAMLASLWLLSGLQGLPFAEDLEDLIDTLAQALGFKVGSIRMEIAKFIDGVFPGMSPYFLQGVVNSAVPADIAGRVSLGNVFPGTGILLSGADVGRELSDIAGPAPSALVGSAKFFADLMRVPFSDRIQALDVAREAPVTMLRAVGDAVAYAKSDAIVDRRGYVVADEANAGVIAARLLGFYPQAAAEQYSAIRVATRVTDYQRDVVAGFRQAWVKAKMEGDEDRAREIVQSVETWNKGAEGTGLTIDNFVKNSQKALKQAKMPAGERTLKTTPKAGREDIERAFDTLSY